MKTELQKKILNLSPVFIIIIFLIVTIIYTHRPKEVDFYCDSGDWGIMRIPLLPPYAISCTNSTTYEPWILGGIEPFGIEVEEIDVIDSLIVAMYYPSHIVPMKRDTIWYIIVPQKNTRYTCKTKACYLNTLSTFTRNKPNFRSGEDLWHKYTRKGYLEWFPQKYKGNPCKW